MKALKSDLARSLVSVDWNTMTAKASDGTEYRMSAVSGAPTSGAVEKAGWKWVPIEPTPEMLWSTDVKVGLHSWDNSQDNISDGEARAVWAQMISAAPHPSEAKAGRDA